MKGVILAGGKGTRLEPFTKIINKHLLPVGSHPMIYWPIISLVRAGIEDILIITNEEDVNEFKAVFGNGKDLQARLSFAIQKESGGGIANAIKCAKDFIDDKFIVLLGDNLFDDDLKPYVEEYKGEKKGAKVLLKDVKDPERYGIAMLNESNHSIISITEKPKNPASTFCVTGIYFYDKNVFDLIETLQPSSRGELEITDLNNLYICRNELKYNILKGWWQDAGTHKSLFEANKHFFDKETK